LQANLEKEMPAHAREVLELQEMVRQSVEQTRNLAHGFYPVDLVRLGLMPALKLIAAGATRTFGVACAVEANGAGELPIGGQAAIQLFRIGQEALHNAVRHGQASRVVLRLSAGRGVLTLSVRDDGVGCPAGLDRVRGMGLRIMRYRAQMIGGEVQFLNRPRGGASVICTMPLDLARAAD
jgi:signal transduction histidine kinase